MHLENRIRNWLDAKPELARCTGQSVASGAYDRGTTLSHFRWVFNYDRSLGERSLRGLSAHHGDVMSAFKREAKGHPLPHASKSSLHSLQPPWSDAWRSFNLGPKWFRSRRSPTEVIVDIFAGGLPLTATSGQEGAWSQAKPHGWKQTWKITEDDS